MGTGGVGQHTKGRENNRAKNITSPDAVDPVTHPKGYFFAAHFNVVRVRKTVFYFPADAPVILDRPSVLLYG